MGGLGRVNLLVGKNNSGKASVLEALHLLSYGGDITALWQLCGRRGERFGDERDLRYGPEVEIDVSHLFAGHELSIGSKFKISAMNQSPERSVSFEIVDRPKQDRGEQVPVTGVEEGILRPRMALRILSTPPTPPTPPRTITLTPRGGINYEYVDNPRRVIPNGRRPQDVQPTSHLISTNSLNGAELTRLWDRIQLTPQEGLVLDALKFIDPKIEQIKSDGRVSNFRRSRRLYY